MSKTKPIGSKTLTTTKTGKTYVRIKISNLPVRTWPYEHRVVAEQMLGRKLLRNEDVHHRNGNTLDNRPENLEVIAHAEHSSYHHSLAPGKWAEKHEQCVDCGTTKRKHNSHGRCLNCHAVIMRAQKRGMVVPQSY